MTRPDSSGTCPQQYSEETLEYLPHLCDSALLHQPLLHAGLQPPCMHCECMQHSHELCLQEGQRHDCHACTYRHILSFIADVSPYPNELLQHGLLESISAWQVAAQTIVLQSLRNGCRMGAPCCCKSFWVLVCLAIQWFLPLLCHSKIHKHLQAAPRSHQLYEVVAYVSAHALHTSCGWGFTSLN